jgi:hypothetical protein
VAHALCLSGATRSNWPFRCCLHCSNPHCSHAQTGNENQAFLTQWINSHAEACKRIGKPFVLEEFGKNVTSAAKAPADWKKVRGPMFSHAFSEYISSLENGGNYQGESCLPAGSSFLASRAGGIQLYGPDS